MCRTRLAAVLGVVLPLLPPVAAAPAHDAEAITAWSRARGLAIATDDPTADNVDLRPLATSIGAARVVGLGEATHGSREFFRLKHRLIRWLVEEHGFTLFAMESGLPEGRLVDRYLAGEEVPPALAQEALSFAAWRTEEVRDLLAWLRQHNASRPPEERVRFAGIDMQSAGAAARALLDYLAAVDPEGVEEFRPPLQQVAKSGAVPSRSPALEKFTEVLDRLGAQFDELEESYIAASDETQYAWARQFVRLLAQNAGLFGNAPPTGNQAVREQSMAENLRFVLDQMAPSTRAIVWAHNAHVAADPEFQGQRWMGGWLRESMGNGYFALGFAFDRGAFQAYGFGPGATSMQEFRVGSALPGTLEAPLAADGRPRFFLDLRDAAAAPAVQHWLDSPAPMQLIGGAFYAETHAPGAGSWPPVKPRASFDALLFVTETTRARPLR